MRSVPLAKKTFAVSSSIAISWRKRQKLLSRCARTGARENGRKLQPQVHMAFMLTIKTATNSRIPPTAVGGSFKSRLHNARLCTESPRRQSGDLSSPTYKQRRRDLSNPRSPPAKPNESPTDKPTSAEAIVVLNDRGGTITVDKNGDVIGLGVDNPAISITHFIHLACHISSSRRTVV
jgi:hypothetical protein